MRKIFIQTRSATYWNETKTSVKNGSVPTERNQNEVCSINRPRARAIYVECVWHGPCRKMCLKKRRIPRFSIRIRLIGDLEMFVSSSSALTLRCQSSQIITLIVLTITSVIWLASRPLFGCDVRLLRPSECFMPPINDLFDNISSAV